MAEDASLLDRALARSSRPKAVCGARLAMDQNPELAPQIEELIAAWPRAEYASMAEVLAERGIDVSADTLSRHNRGKCSCR